MYLDVEHKSLSFGAALPIGDSMDTCRYQSDYHGDAQFELLQAHFWKHAKRLRDMLQNMPTCQFITLQIAVSSLVYKTSANSKMKELILQHPRFKRYVGGENRAHTQLVCDYKFKEIMKH